jgi:3-oxoacyl-[acyl-carrier-protein] synthase II
MLTGFARLGALSTRNGDPETASRPFDLGRDGFVLGEGAGLIVVASAAAASTVGDVLGWLVGYGCSSNAWRITDSPADGRGAADAMTDALRDAGLDPSSVAYINAHGTGTLQNDRSEARGIRTVFGECAVPVSSTKGAMGHLVAACGAVEAVITLEAVRQGIAPPTRNLERPDPDCDITHVVDARPLTPGVGLSNAFGFGGSNASLVVAAP